MSTSGAILFVECKFVWQRAESESCVHSVHGILTEFDWEIDLRHVMAWLHGWMCQGMDLRMGVSMNGSTVLSTV